MRLPTLAILCASASFIALPAFAQNPEHANSAMEHNNGSSAWSQNQGAQEGTNPRQVLKQDLKKAGFTHIRIEPEAFVVHAKNSQGEPVLMRITPDTMEAVTAMNENGQGNNGEQANSNRQGNTSEQANQNGSNSWNHANQKPNHMNHASNTNQGTNELSTQPGTRAQ